MPVEEEKSGNFLPMFRDNLSVLSSRFKNSFGFLLDCSFLSYYPANSGNFLPTFRDNLSVLSSRFKNPFGFLLDCSFLGYYSANNGNFLPTFRDNPSALSSGFKDTSWRKSEIRHTRCVHTTLHAHARTSSYNERSKRCIYQTVQLIFTHYEVRLCYLTC
jgi:hypothetical protein